VHQDRDGDAGQGGPHHGGLLVRRQHVRLHRQRREVDGGDASHSEPGYERPTTTAHVGLPDEEREHGGGPDHEQQKGNEQPPGESRLVERGELEELLDHLGAVVDATVVVVVELVAAEGDATDEPGHQSVGPERLGQPVQQQRGGDRHEPVEAVVEESSACRRGTTSAARP